MKVLETAVGAVFASTRFSPSKNFHSRPGCRRKILSKEFWGWGWGSKFEPRLCLPLFGVCPLVSQKLVLSVPFFPGWQGSWGSRSKNFALEGPMEQMLVQGHSVRLPDEVWGSGISGIQKPENRDSQHMLNQHMGSFPEL